MTPQETRFSVGFLLSNFAPLAVVFVLACGSAPAQTPVPNPVVDRLACTTLSFSGMSYAEY